MLNSIYFLIKTDVCKDKHQVLELFFKDWVDTSCNNEVQYKVEQLPGVFMAGAGSIIHATPIFRRFRVDFEKQEDALALRLRGVPEEFQNYLEIVNHSD
jgi:hypothetical protein